MSTGVEKHTSVRRHPQISNGNLFSLCQTLSTDIIIFHRQFFDKQGHNETYGRESREDQPNNLERLCVNANNHIQVSI